MHYTDTVERVARWLYERFGNPARGFDYLNLRERQNWRNDATVAIATTRGHERVGAGFAEPGMVVVVWAAEGTDWEDARRCHDLGNSRYHRGTIAEITEDRENEDVRIKLSSGALLATKSYAATFVEKRAKASRK